MQKFQDEDQILFEAIEAYRNGNGDKATVIYESTKKYTYKIVHQEVARFKSQSILTGDEISITEDVLQDLYFDFFNNIAKFRNEDPRSIFKWISIVSHRMVLGYVDKNKMEVLQFEKDDDYREENDIWDSSEINDADMESNHELLPEAALEDKEFQQLILDFIQSLPEAQAQTVLLHFRGGMKYQEIADEMGVSLITVKTRMKKAKDSLEEIITKYEKKTGTKLHSVSILPLLWLLYRMSSENATVPVAVDTAVTGSLAGIATTGSIASAGATAATKAISTRVLVAIVSTAVVIGGVAVGSQIVEKKQESNISTERDDLEDSGSDDNQQDNDKMDKDTSNKETDEGNSETNQNETAGDNNGSDTNNTGSDNNVTQEGNGTGNNTNGTDSNTGTGNSSGNDGTSGNGDDSGNEDQGEATTANGTQENPYKVGDKIAISNVTNVNSRDTSTYDIELTIMDYTVPKLENAVHVSFSNTEMILNVIKSKIKVTRDSSEAYGEVPLIFDLLSEDGKVYGQSGYLHKQDGNIITNISNNVEYDIGFHMTASSFNGESTYTYFRITYLNENRSYSYIYFKL